MSADDYWRDWALRLMDKSDHDLNQELQPIDEANRNIVRGLIAELRAHGQPVVPTPMTRLQLEKVPQIPGIVRKLRRSDPRGATKTSVALKLEINRDTLDDWIKAGIVHWPPDATAE